MHFVYCIQDKRSKELYYGYTENLIRRLKEHNKKGKVWALIYYEVYRSEDDARKRERKLKDYGQSRTHLKNRINDSLLSE